MAASPGQSGKSFLRNHAAGIAAMDLLVVPTIGFRLLYGFVILNHRRRRIRTVAVTSHPTAEWIARQIAEAFPSQDAPLHRPANRTGRIVAIPVLGGSIITTFGFDFR